MQTFNMLLEESSAAPAAEAGQELGRNELHGPDGDLQGSFTRRRSTVETLDDCLNVARNSRFDGLASFPTYMPETSQSLPPAPSAGLPRQISLPVDLTSAAWEDDPNLQAPQPTLPSVSSHQSKWRPPGNPGDASTFKTLVEHSSLPFPWHQHMGELQQWRSHDPANVAANLDRRGSTDDTNVHRFSVSDDSYRYLDRNDVGGFDMSGYRASAVNEDWRFSTTEDAARCAAVARHNDTRAALLRMRHNAQSQLQRMSNPQTGEDLSVHPTNPESAPSGSLPTISDHETMERRSSFQSCDSFGSGDMDSADMADADDAGRAKRQQRARRRYAEQQEKIQSLEHEYSELSSIGNDIESRIRTAEEEIERLSARETELLAIQRVFDSERKSLEQKIKVAKASDS
eukprot:CAMPEP_0117652122 /NCGR_PEP_ID=MMETSP0804-20121206/2459_1 /TAXON_ID=1074897 /ORGANISM="Tetraselmis astigmatica, Strain CCMP880" /LENGTH=400 /DNA_ID=CAMNT_0005458149 /DNA_START=266 /DNA_END=1468 /DNA_ORIENTATION=+